MVAADPANQQLFRPLTRSDRDDRQSAYPLPSPQGFADGEREPNWNRTFRFVRVVPSDDEN
jgi:hypothetical protein